jgi:hypothetical protein
MNGITTQAVGPSDPVSKPSGLGIRIRSPFLGRSGTAYGRNSGKGRDNPQRQFRAKDPNSHTVKNQLAHAISAASKLLFA